MILSRVRQGRPIQERVDLWFAAIQGFLDDRPAAKLFNLLDTGELVPWEVRDIEP